MHSIGIDVLTADSSLVLASQRARFRDNVPHLNLGSRQFSIVSQAQLKFYVNVFFFLEHTPLEQWLNEQAQNIS